MAEDDAGVRDLIRTRLTAAGYDTHTARDGIEAVRRIRELRPDGLILDINMPGMDGFGVLETIRADANVRNTRVLVLTARHVNRRPSLSPNVRFRRGRQWQALTEAVKKRGATIFGRNNIPKKTGVLEGSCAHSVWVTPQWKNVARKFRTQAFLHSLDSKRKLGMSARGLTARLVRRADEAPTPRQRRQKYTLALDAHVAQVCPVTSESRAFPDWSMPTSLKPVARPPGAGLAYSLPEQIADRIAEAIIEERYPSGSRLKEVELATAFGVSRAPIREALRILETQKLVRLTPQKGALVVQLSTEELAELFSIRAALMGLSIRKLAETGSDDALDALEARVAELESLAGAGNLSRYVRRLGDLSQYAAELSGPGWIMDLLLITIRQTVKFTRRGLLTQEAVEDVNSRWRQVLAALRARDADLAESEARALMLAAWRRAIPTLEHKTSPKA